MKGVPGVMTLLSNASDFCLGGTLTPSRLSFSLSFSSSSSVSLASCAARNRRDRC